MPIPFLIVDKGNINCGFKTLIDKIIVCLLCVEFFTIIIKQVDLYI